MRWVLHPGSRLSQKVISAGFWVLVLRIAQQLIILVRTVVLARVLGPQDFGIVAVALMSQTILDVLSNTGFRSALVQKKGDIRGYLDTAWTVGLVRYCLLGAALFLLASPVAAFFGVPQSRPVIQMVAAAFLLRGLQNIGLVYLRKELAFHKEFLFNIGSALANTGIAIPLALILRNYWALAYGVLAEGVAALALSYLVRPYRPRPRLELAKALELFNFGKWVVMGNVGIFLVSQADRLVVAKLMGPVALGLYQVGTRVAFLFANELSESIRRIGFPAYSKIQDNLPTLRWAALGTLEVSLCLTLPLAVALAVLAPQLVGTVFGEQWLPAVPVVQVLAFASVVRVMAAAVGTPFLGLGKPRVATIATTLGLVSMAALLWPLTRTLGLVGTSATVLVGDCVSMAYLSRRWQTDMGVGLEHFLRALAPGMALGLAVLAASLAGHLALSGDGILPLVSSLALSGLAYLVGCVTLWKVTRMGPLQMLSALRLSRVGR